MNPDDQLFDLHKPCALCKKPIPPNAQYCPSCGYPADEPAPEGVFRFTPANNFLVTLMAVATLFALVYRFNSHEELTQTYAAFIGLPLLIGVLVAYLTRPQTGLGTTLKVTTVILCAVCPLLGEGAICILMAAPIFYTIAVIGYLIVAGLIRLINPKARGGPLGLTLLPFILAMMTHGPDGIRNPRTMTVTQEIEIHAPPDVVWRTLQRDDLVTTDFPLFLRLGFPLPTKLERYPDGVVRLAFDPGSEKWVGTNAILSHERIDAPGRRLTFAIENDGTMLANWLAFQTISFEIEPVGNGTRLRQITIFRQRLQPGLYWNPLEGYAMGQMHAYALNNIKRLAEATVW